LYLDIKVVTFRWEKLETGEKANFDYLLDSAFSGADASYSI